MKDNELKLRILHNDDSDYKLLEKWYKEKEIYSHFEQRILTYDEIKNKYSKRTSESSRIPVYMIEYNKKPVGIIQYQLINEDNRDLYGITNEKSYEIDIFIGEINFHNKGIGTRSIKILSDYLFNKRNASLLVMCPLEDNYNAIRCYEKCGFKKIKIFKTEDTIGDVQNYLLMIKNEV